MQVFVSPHFTWDEVKCHCGCNDGLVDPRLLKALEELRALGPEPIIVNDCCRCLLHNKEVMGVGKSSHLFWHGDATRGTGDHYTCAADIRIKGLSLQEMFDRALKVPDFEKGGIGIYDGAFVHCDTRVGRMRWARVAGKYIGLQISGLVKV